MRLNATLFRWGLLGGLLCGSLPQSGHAQELRALALECGGTSEALLAWCHETALAAQAAQGAFGLAASGGTDTPGSASTLGWRMKGSPRISLSVRGSLTRGSMPDLRTRDGLPRGDRSFDLPAGHALVSVGLFDGFSLAPAFGGFLSVDLTGAFHKVSAPKQKGFQDGVQGWGGGIRLGILRESFTLPGITLSASRRWLGEVRLDSHDEGDLTESRFDVSVSSLRAVMGKDILGLGLFVGTGWDRYGGDMSLSVMDPAGGGPPPGGDSPFEGSPTSERCLFFAGGGMTFVVFQISAEAGWAQGFDNHLPERGPGDFDPSSKVLFGSLAFRLTF